jgi:hypothetical protein
LILVGKDKPPAPKGERHPHKTFGQRSLTTDLNLKIDRKVSTDAA